MNITQLEKRNCSEDFKIFKSIFVLILIGLKHIFNRSKLIIQNDKKVVLNILESLQTCMFIFNYFEINLKAYFQNDKYNYSKIHFEIFKSVFSK